MGFVSLVTSLLWLLLSLLQATLHLLGLPPSTSFSSWLITTMAKTGLWSSSTLARLRDLLGLQEPKLGHPPDLTHQLPVFVRRDGVIIRLGAIVERVEGSTDQLFVVTHILARYDLGTVSLGLVLVKDKEEEVEVLGEETVAEVEEVRRVRGRNIIVRVARDGMESVARNIASYPEHIQRTVRRHQLSALLRREVQRFLSGFSTATTIKLGGVDWRLDPGILGLERETDFSLEYRVENFVSQDSHLDLMLGSGWDVRPVAATSGFRVVLTLELAVDVDQELTVKVDGIFCTSKLEVPGYRAACLKVARRVSNQQTVPSIFLHTGDKLDSNCCQSGASRGGKGGVTGAGVTLAWDEFQINSAESSPSQHAVASNTVSMDDLLFTRSLPGLQGTSTARHTLDKLLSAIPQSQLLFDSPIKEDCVEGFNLSNKGSSTGPNTSTPADDLDQDVGDRTSNMSRGTGMLEGSAVSRGSSPSLPDHKTVQEGDITRRCLAVDDTQGIASQSPILNSLGSPSPVLNLLESHSPVLNLPESHSLVLNLSESHSPVLNLPESPSPVLNLPESHSPVLNLPESHSPVLNLPESHSPVLNLPERHSPVLNLPENNSPVSNLPENNSPVSNLPDNNSPVLILPDNHSPVTNLPEKPSVLNLPGNPSPVPNLPENNSPVLNLPENHSPVLNIPENDSCGNIAENNSPIFNTEDPEEMHTSPDCVSQQDERQDTSSNSGCPAEDDNIFNSLPVATLDLQPGSDGTKVAVVDRVAEYLQSLPMPEMKEVLEAIPSPVQQTMASESPSTFQEAQLDNSCQKNLSMDNSYKRNRHSEDIEDDDMNVSVNSSRQSDRSSLTGSNRFLRGMFQGATISNVACPFPDDWQFNTIPESIENDDDID